MHCKADCLAQDERIIRSDLELVILIHSQVRGVLFPDLLKFFFSHVVRWGIEAFDESCIEALPQDVPRSMGVEPTELLLHSFLDRKESLRAGGGPPDNLQREDV